MKYIQIPVVEEKKRDLTSKRRLIPCDKTLNASGA